MTIRTSPASSPKNASPQRYNILNDLALTVEITSNPLELPLEALFGMAARKNKKRGFLFVSKVLGKHIPIQPQVGLLAGRALALLLSSEQVKSQAAADELLSLCQAFEEPASAEEIYARVAGRKITVEADTLFIGFAETATALGHSLFAAFDGPVTYLHTTREEIPGRISCISFEEEHSHATSHRCYMDEPERFALAKTIVLVDDELTTGKTALNIILDLRQKYGNVDYVVASLLDWRSDADRERFAAFEAEHGVRIRTLSLLSGRFTVTGQPIEGEQKVTVPDAEDVLVYDTLDVSGCFTEASAIVASDISYLQHSGRFGITAEGQHALDEEITQAAGLCLSKRTGKQVLCMGTGEFMYIPMRIAAEMGQGISYQSTTRSPIHPSEQANYAVKNAWSFHPPEHPEILNYLYNIPEGHYDELFFFMERPLAMTEELRQVLASLPIPSVHIVTFTRRPNEA